MSNSLLVVLKAIIKFQYLCLSRARHNSMFSFKTYFKKPCVTSKQYNAYFVYKFITKQTKTD